MANYVLDHTGQQVNTKLTKAENTDNKVTSISSSSTDTQYPSAKLLYNQLQLKQNSSSAFSGNYNDLTNKPTIPTVGNTKIYYGTCATKNSTAAKVVVCNDFVLETGATIVIKMTNAMTASSATLNINGTGAIALKHIGTTNAGKYYWNSGEIVTVTYDGTNYVMHDGALATTAYYGVTKLTTSATSTSTNVALTPASLNSLVNGMIADYPIYSTTTAYAVGDKVRYNYNNWQCNTAIAEGGETWNAEHWTALSPLQTQIDNKADKATTLSGYGITDASISNGIITLGNNTITPLTSHQDISGKQDNKPNGTNLLIDNSTGKINATYIPDSLLGQVIFGGIITGKGESDGPDGQEIIVTLSATAKSILRVSSNTITIGEEEQLILYDKMFFINNLSDSNFNFANLILNTGDWLINLSNSWQKIDNTDAVSSVNGKVGNITLKTSDLQNDSGYLTSHQSLTNYYNKTDVNNLLDGKADANHTHSQYLTSHQDISGKENSSNKVTSISSSSTDTQYPSAKLLYDQLALKAPLASPSLTGTPTAPTATAGTNTTQIATTAFVNTAISGKQDKLSQGDSQEFIDTDSTGVMKRSGYSITTNKNVIIDRNSAASFIPNARAIAQAVFASPAFTGTPTAPTAASGTNTTQIATTAFVQSEISDKQKQHITLTLTLNASSWSNHSLTVTATGVTASNTVIVSYPIDSLQIAVDSQVYCSAQDANSLTFTCIGQTPVDNITANVLILPT